MEEIGLKYFGGMKSTELGAWKLCKFSGKWSAINSQPAHTLLPSAALGFFSNFAKLSIQLIVCVTKGYSELVQAGKVSFATLKTCTIYILKSSL